MSIVTTKIVGSVLVASVDNPPVNAISHAVRLGLRDAIHEATDNDAVEAVVIRCDGRTFFAGADIKEFGKPSAEPGLADVAAIIEDCPKPVVAAIHGTALGGGLEIALGCHFRIAAKSASLGLPEVKLGIIPGAGGTQRLPRLIGVEHSLPMIQLGDPINAAKAQEIGLVDQLSNDGNLENDATMFAKEVGKDQRRPVTSALTETIGSIEDADSAIEQFQAKFKRKLRGLEAPVAGFEAIRAAVTMPFAGGMKKEFELFLSLVSGVQSKALTHVFFAERAANKIADIPADTQTLPIKSVGVLGAGTMGGGIAMNFLSAGIPVTLVEREAAPLERGVANIRKNYEATARRGRLTQEQVEHAMSLITPTVDFDALATCDLIIEAVFEDMDVKRDVFARLDSTAKAGAILASNTSYLDIDALAAETSRPESVIGLHFFSPANIMKLLEVVRGEKTGPDVLKTAMALARKIKKVAVVSGVCHGFIGNRMLSQRQAQAHALVLQGPRPWDVDAVLTEFGFPMGPFQMADLAGLDIGWNPEKSSSATVMEVLCERGRRGQKTGKGYYDYDENRKNAPSAETEDIIDAFIAKAGQSRRDIGKDDILARLLYPMVNEGAKILQEGVAQRSSDIDTVWLNGYGWPAWTGGPMFWADTIGLQKIVDGLKAFDIEPAALLVSKASNGEQFSS